MSQINRENVTRWIEDVSFSTPPENQGQIVLVSYGCDEDYIYKRVYDQSDRSTIVRVYEHPENETGAETDFDPWNKRPDLGKLVGSCEM